MASVTRMPGGWASPTARGSQAVVVSNAVPMVDRLVRKQVAAEHLLHHENVFEHVWHTSGSRMTGHPRHDVARLVPRPTAPPVPVELTTVLSAPIAGRRLPLLGPSAS